MGAAALGLLAAATAIAWWIFALAADRELAAQMRDARAEGLILDLGEVSTPKTLPPSDNAAPLYLKAYGGARGNRRELDDLKWLSGPILARVATNDERADARLELKSVHSQLDLIRAGAARPACDFARDWRKGLELTFPDLSAYRQLGAALAVDAMLSAQDGDAPASFSDLSALARMGANLIAQPSMIEGGSGTAAQSVCLNALESALAVLPMTKDRSDQIGDLARAFGTYVSVRQTLRSELPLERDVLERLAAGQDIGMEGMEGMAMVARIPSVRRRAEIRMLSQWRSTYKALVTERTDYQRTRAALDAATNLGPAKDPADALLFMFPSVTGIYKTRAEAEMRRRIVVSVAAIFAAWARTGSWPSSLPDLGLDSTDLFTGHPLCYVPKPGGFKLYSCAEDGVDDGGKRRDYSASSRDGYDLVFEYPRARESRPALHLFTRPAWRPGRPGVASTVGHARGPATSSRGTGGEE